MIVSSLLLSVTRVVLGKRLRMPAAIIASCSASSPRLLVALVDALPVRVAGCSGRPAAAAACWAPSRRRRRRRDRRARRQARCAAASAARAARRRSARTSATSRACGIGGWPGGAPGRWSADAVTGPEPASGTTGWIVVLGPAATLSVRSSLSSPTYSLHAVGPDLRDRHAVDGLALHARGATCRPWTSLQEGRRLAVDDDRARERELAALHPGLGDLGRDGARARAGASD